MNHTSEKLGEQGGRGARRGRDEIEMDTNVMTGGGYRNRKRCHKESTWVESCSGSQRWV